MEQNPPSAATLTEEKRPNYFLWTSIIFIVLSYFAVVYPDLLTGKIVSASDFAYRTFDWLVMWMPLAALTLGGYLVFSKYGSIRLGGKNSVAEFSMFSWMSMLFTAGIGVGIIFYGPIEGLWHYFNGPFGEASNASLTDKIETSMAMALHVWGFPAWSLYMIAGVVVAYFSYQHDCSFSPADCISYAYKKKKWAHYAAIIIVGVAIISIALSVSSSIAMATSQIASGLQIITNFDVDYINFNSISWRTILLVIISASFTLASVLPIAKGMKFLGDWTVYISLALLVFIFIFGPTHYFMVTIVNTFGRIITSTINFSFELYPFEKRDYIVWFPMAYWVWWITWAPFVGVFLAKISKGRTIREFILASVLVPSGFILVWFSVFSGYSMLDMVEADGVLAVIARSGEYAGGVYYLLETLPLAVITKPIVALLFLGFVITTVTSAGISLGIMTSKDGKTETKFRAVVWCIFMTIISYAVIYTGKIEGIKAVGSFAGFPFVFLLFLMVAALFKQLRKDTKYSIEKD